MRFKNILLIDDDPEDRELFLAALNSLKLDAGCQLMPGGKEALLWLDTDQKTPDLIIVDLNMPIMSGYQFLEEKVKRPWLAKVPIYVLTTSNDRTFLREAEKLGATASLTKPNSLIELIALIKTLIC